MIDFFRGFGRAAWAIPPSHLLRRARRYFLEFLQDLRPRREGRSRYFRGLSSAVNFGPHAELIESLK